MKSSRRNFIKNTAGIAALLATGNNFLPFRAYSKSTSTGNQLRIPSVFTENSFNIEKKLSTVWPDSQLTETFSLTGNYPGPLLRIKRGEMFTMNVKNSIEDEVTIHWHGMELPAKMDGHPMDAIMPGASFTYQYPILNRAGTYFFHSHTHGKTAPQVFKGLAGVLVIEDEEEQALDLPRGEYDIPLLIQDLRFDANRQIDYAPTSLDKMVGYMGDTVVVNGTPNAFHMVKRGLYRLRLINASNSRIYKLAFSDKKNFHVIASDGGLLQKPVEVNTLTIAPAERYEILVNFSGYSNGSSVMLRSEEFEAPTHMGMVPDFPQGMPLDILQFNINGDGIQQSIPLSLSQITRIDPASAKRVRSFEMGMTSAMVHTINDKLYDMHRIDEKVPFGETEIWEFINTEDDMLHPMHVHGVQFQIISRNGNTEIPAHEMGWKDTFLMGPSETVRVILNFDKYEGMYLMHCHNLEHEDDGMMMNFSVEKTTGIEEESASKSDLTVQPNPCDQYAVLEFLPAAQEQELRITNANGKTFLKGTIPAHQKSIQLPVWQIASGQYFCTVGRKTTQFIIAR